MSQLAPFLNAMIALGLLIGSCAAMCGGLWLLIFLLHRERPRPFHPGDDVPGECPNVPSLSAPRDFEVVHGQESYP